MANVPGIVFFGDTVEIIMVHRRMNIHKRIAVSQTRTDFCTVAKTFPSASKDNIGSTNRVTMAYVLNSVFYNKVSIL